MTHKVGVSCLQVAFWTGSNKAMYFDKKVILGQARKKCTSCFVG
jgi:hypothetical protein